MKLFIDTSNKKFILALINNHNKVEHFFMVDTDNDIVKNSVSILEKFLKENKVEIKDINGYMFTIGPGSFTGVKVALNIISTINMVNKLSSFEIISTFKLLRDYNKKYVAIKFGKSKYYLKNYKSFLKPKVVTDISKINKNELIIDYEGFSKEILESKIANKSFKLLDNLGKVRINYLFNYK